MGLLQDILEIINPPPVPEVRVVTIVLVPREDGGLRISSPDIRALDIQGGEPSAVLRDLGPALDRHLFQARETP